MRTLILSSAAVLAAVSAPAQAQDLGTILNSVIGGGYSNAYQPYGYQPTYSYQPAYGYVPGYGYSRSNTNAYRSNAYQYSRYGYSNYGQRSRYGNSRYGQYSEGRNHRDRRNGREHDRDRNDD